MLSTAELQERISLLNKMIDYAGPEHRGRVAVMRQEYEKQLVVARDESIAVETLLVAKSDGTWFVGQQGVTEEMLITGGRYDPALDQLCLLQYRVPKPEPRPLKVFSI